MLSRGVGKSHAGKSNRLGGWAFLPVAPERIVYDKFSDLILELISPEPHHRQTLVELTAATFDELTEKHNALHRRALK